MTRTAFAALALGLVLAAPAAASDFQVAIDLDYTVPTNDGLDSAGHGPHFGARVGYALGLPVVDLVLEARGTTLNFPSNLEEEKDGWAGWGVQGGARVGVGLGVFRPALFAHVGYGETEVSGSDYVSHHGGYLIDGGLAATFTLLPVVGFGAQVAYNTLLDMEKDSTAEWVSFGAHVEFRL